MFNSKFSLKQIRGYFGEKIALYFYFLHCYTRWLIIPALLGLIVFIARMMPLDAEYEDDISAIYCIGIVIWGTVFMEYWK
mmetsp:Transcript_8874/g.1268  ORF Transcript_8874/g.1268 Transcript_8874/m.1268 type:complete len:80 (+) Transcript_8874:787-1026(+)